MAMVVMSSSIDIVERYARQVTTGIVIAGSWVRLQCERHLRDLATGKSRGIYYDKKAADRALRFFPSVLKLAGGEFEGKPFELQPWQAFIIGSLFGWMTDDGYRRFRVAFVEIGKGNGKSPMAGGIGLYMLTADKEERAEVYAAAVDKEQASVLFRDAVAMVEQSPELSKRMVTSGAKGREWNLAFHKTSSFFRPIASESKGRGKSGIRPHCALLDEVHEHPTNSMVEFMRAGTKGRKQAMIFMITNSGFDRTTVCYHYHEYAERVLKGEIDDDGFFPYVCALDEKDDWKDELVWLKANPNLGVSIDLKYLREQVREATGMPSKQSIVKRLNFCMWVDAENPWIDGDTWRSALGSIDRDVLRQRHTIDETRCYGGLDLSGKNDLTALSVVFPAKADGEKKLAITWFWTPQENVNERENRDRTPYKRWIEEGFLETTPGRTIDYAFTAMRVLKCMEEFGLYELAFDRWRIGDFTRELDDLQVNYQVVNFGGEVDLDNPPDLILRPHGQGFVDMAPAVDQLETDIANGNMVVENNPVMNMCSANAVLVSDAAANRKFDKRESRGRIDGIVALAMADRCASLVGTSGKSFWE
jgi:phage terminase large subunit-like protein